MHPSLAHWHSSATSQWKIKRAEASHIFHGLEESSHQAARQDEPERWRAPLLSVPELAISSSLQDLLCSVLISPHEPPGQLLLAFIPRLRVGKPLAPSSHSRHACRVVYVDAGAGSYTVPGKPVSGETTLVVSKSL